MGTWNKNFEDLTIGELSELHNGYKNIRELIEVMEERGRVE